MPEVKPLSARIDEFLVDKLIAENERLRGLLEEICVQMKSRYIDSDGDGYADIPMPESLWDRLEEFRK